MVYEKDTFRLFHELTDYGREIWQKMLEAEADWRLFKHEHPLKALVQIIKGQD